MPLSSVSFRPVVSSKVWSEQPPILPHEQRVELVQRVATVMTFEIVFGPEQALAAGLALAARDRTQCVETARDRAEKALFRIYVRGDRPEERRLRLIGAAGAGREAR